LQQCNGHQRLRQRQRQRHSDRNRDSDSMMCIDMSPGAYAMQMAGKYTRKRHGTYSMGLFDTWRASEAADINRPFRTARMTSEDVDAACHAGQTKNVPNHLKHPAQQLRVCARSTIYHTHTLLSIARLQLCFSTCWHAGTHSHSFSSFTPTSTKDAGGKTRVSSFLSPGACACGPANNCPW